MSSELQRAQIIDGLCQRWGCTPSQVLAEDASLVFGLFDILAGAEDAPASHLGLGMGKDPSIEEMLAAMSRSI